MKLVIMPTGNLLKWLSCNMQRSLLKGRYIMPPQALLLLHTVFTDLGAWVGVLFAVFSPPIRSTR
jgi:hypothetical protein